MYTKQGFFWSWVVSVAALITPGCTPTAPAEHAPNPTPECPATAAALELAPSPGASPEPAPEYSFVIEAESMALSAAEVVSAEGASGGQAVKMLPNAVASIDVALPSGQYVLNAVFNAEDHDHDGFFLAAGEKAKRTNAHRHQQWVYGARFLVLETDGSEPVTVRFTSNWEGLPPAEAGMVVDRLELVELSHSAEALQRWGE